MQDEKNSEFKVGWRTPQSLAECRSEFCINCQNMIRKADELSRYVWLLGNPESNEIGQIPAAEQEYAKRDEIIEHIRRMLASHIQENEFIQKCLIRIRTKLSRVREDARQAKLQGTADAYADSVRELEQELLDAECIERDHRAAERYVRIAIDRQRLRPWPGKDKPRKSPPLVLPEIPNPAESREKRGDSSRKEPMSTQVRKLIEEGPLWR